MRICCNCHESKILSSFRRSRNTCTKCERSKYITSNLTNWLKYILSKAKSRLKDSDISVDDLYEIYAKQDGKCFYFNIPMLLPKNFKDPQSITIDRIDNSKSYTKDNVVLACYAANVGRNTTDYNRFKEFVDLMKENIIKCG